jgi:hypothetical protein
MDGLLFDFYKSGGGEEEKEAKTSRQYVLKNTNARECERQRQETTTNEKKRPAGPATAENGVDRHRAHKQNLPLL